MGVKNLKDKVISVSYFLKYSKTPNSGFGQKNKLKNKPQEWVLPLLKYKPGLKKPRLGSNSVNYYSTV